MNERPALSEGGGKSPFGRAPVGVNGRKPDEEERVPIWLTDRYSFLSFSIIQTAYF